MEQQLQLLRIFFIHHIELIVENAADPVRRTINFRDFLCVQSSADHAIGAGIDNCRRSAGLPKDAGADQFLTH